ncbi:MAG TPA: FAD-binding oxidoreductase [Ramlibacter sp.]|nr:FAD-binding oxidoreductase [Ramlibacter sp.]
MLATTLASELKRIVGVAGWSDAADTMAPHLHDFTGAYHGSAGLLLKPATAQQVAQIVRACATSGTAIVPQGGNTGLVGGGVPAAGGPCVLLNLARMNRVREIDATNNTITVDAGCVLAEVQAQATAVDRLFPLSLGSEGSAQIGGNLSTNAGGVQVLRYGMARDLVLGLEVVLPDGTLMDSLRGLRKDNTGYDLKQLFIGAEGTLGVITAAVLKLFPRPAVTETAFLAIRDADAAVEILNRLRSATGDAVTACELMSGFTLELVLRNIAGARAPLEGRHDWFLLVECAGGGTGQGLRHALEATLGLALEQGLAHDVAVAQSQAQAQAFWKLRHTVGESRRPEGACLNHDISVPVSATATFIARAGAACEALYPGCRVSAYGHIGDGNVHFSVLQPQRPAPGAAPDAAFVARADAISREVYAMAIALRGSISAEHGIGQSKREELPLQKSAAEMALMRTLKRALDPQGIMNPGKLLFL